MPGSGPSNAKSREAGTCPICGRHSSIWDRFGRGGLCRSCRANEKERVAHDRALFLGALTAVDLVADLTERQRSIVADTTPEAVGADWHRKTGTAALRFLIDEALTDELLTDAEDDRIRAIGDLVRIDPEAIIKDNAELAERVLLARARDGRLPEVRATPLALRRREICHHKVRADLFETGVVTAGAVHDGLWAAKGVHFSLAGARGVRGRIPTQGNPLDTGILGITNRRLVFRGKQQVLEVRYEDLLGFTIFRDGLALRIAGVPAVPQLRLRGPHVVATLALAAWEQPRVRRIR